MLVLFICLLINCAIGADYASLSNNTVYPDFYTTSVPGDADDIAIWVHPTDSEKSIIFGNDKKLETGGIYAWNMQGNHLFFVPVPRAVNLDVRQNVILQDGVVRDLLVIGERVNNTIKIFEINRETGNLKEITASRIFSGFIKQTYGLGLYHNKNKSKLYVFVSSKLNRHDIHQFELFINTQGKIDGKLVRKFAGQDIQGFVEGIVADDEHGYVYMADEDRGILKYYADIDRGDLLLDIFAQKDDITKDREGLAIYKCSCGGGFIILSNQANSNLKVYNRLGNHNYVATIEKKGSTYSDGIAVNSGIIGKNYPLGMIVAHNDNDKNFAVYNWQKVLGMGIKCECMH